MVVRTLHLNIIGARDLKKVSRFTKMKPYAVVILSGDPRGEQRYMSCIDYEGGRNPTWNSPVQIPIVESAIQQNLLALTVQILSKDRLFGHRDVGTVVVQVRELYDRNPDQIAMVVGPVMRPSGKPKGELMFSYRFGDICVSADEAVGHTADSAGTSSGHPPQRPSDLLGHTGHGSGYAPPHPPPSRYGYALPTSYTHLPPPPQPVYMAAPPPASGVVASLLGRVFGGMVVETLDSHFGGLACFGGTDGS